MMMISPLCTGIELASIAGLPPDVLRRAEEISAQMRRFDAQAEHRSRTHKALRSRKVLLEVTPPSGLDILFSILAVDAFLIDSYV